jgi:two-component system, OmpR family, sensor histidine kinase KdpD
MSCILITPFVHFRMSPSDDSQRDPEAFLRTLKRVEEKERRGKLRVFFGMCAGVGKTFEMLQAAHEAKKKGSDVLVGYVETHGRHETEALLTGLLVVPRKKVEYRGAVLEEMDIDTILTRKPVLVLVDELAHTNAPGSRHTKRYLDVLELLDNGIDVFTTLNVQHLESRADTVAQITGAIVRETVPDSLLEQADELQLVDLSPEDLLKRMAEGKVYTGDRSQRAIRNFFRQGNLTALREMALRLAAERVERQMRDYRQSERIRVPWRAGQRLVVGVTPGKESIRLIRWTRRLASAMQASWVAVFVERASPGPRADSDQFARNISLARELGAEIVTTADEDVATGLLRVAQEQNATQIIVGKPGRARPWNKSLVERLIELSADVDIYVATGTDAAEEKHSWRFRRTVSHSGLSQYAVAAAIVLLLAALCYPFEATLGYQTVSLILILAVVMLPLRFGVGPVILAAAISALTWNYFFIPPRFTFAIAKPQDLLMMMVLFATATVSGVLTARVRTREKAVRSRETRATALYTLTNDLSSAGNQDDVAGAAVLNIRKFFDVDVALFLSELDGDFINRPHASSTYLPDGKELSVPAWVHWNEKKAGRFTDTLPFAEATYFPLSGPRYPLGVIGIKRRNADRLSLDQEALLENFLSQISSALEREFLNEINKRSIAIVESERLYTTLFASISHEMRTPITALIGASEGLLDDKVSADATVRHELAQDIQSAAERLDNVVQNLLAMTRLESGLIQPKLDWTDVRDVINSAIDKLRNDLSGHTVSMDISPDLPLIRLDYALIEQALLNLLRNAAVHTPADSSLEIHAVAEHEACFITISDNGPGIPPESLDKLFEKFYRVPGSRPGGIGLGLSIALGFVQAHHGTLQARNRPEGGAEFIMQLPVESTRHQPVESSDE